MFLFLRRNAWIVPLAFAVLLAGVGWSAYRAVEALLSALDDPDFDVRLQCARAAARHVERDGSPVPLQRVLPLVERELEVGARRWEQQGKRREDTLGESVLLQAGDARRIDRSAEHVFTLLGLAFGPEVMGSTLRALYCEDANLRGTAIEYLMAQLPEGLRNRLWVHIPLPEPTRRRGDSSQKMAEELLRSSARISLPGDR